MFYKNIVNNDFIPIKTISKIGTKFIINDITIPNAKYYQIKFNCKSCNKSITRRLLNFNKPYCSKCIRKETNLEKYGVEYTIQLKEKLEKRKQTNLKKYGHEHAFCFGSREFIDNMKQKHGGVGWGSKDINKKIKATNLKKYGAENVSQSEMIKERKKQINLKKYGVEHQWQSKEVKEKIKKTNIEKYGTEYPMQNNKNKQQFKQTMMNKYGVENPSQVPEFHNKAMASLGQSQRLKVINKDLHYQSIPELEFIRWCNNNEIEVKDGPSIPYYLNGEKHIYHVDFETNKYIVEIKGSHHWYYEDLKSGQIEAKNESAKNYAQEVNKEFLFLLDIKNYEKYFNIRGLNG